MEPRHACEHEKKKKIDFLDQSNQSIFQEIFKKLLRASRPRSDRIHKANILIFQNIFKPLQFLKFFLAFFSKIGYNTSFSKLVTNQQKG